MTHELWVKDKVHCLAVLLMVDSDFREKSASSEICSVSPCFRNDSTVVSANVTLSLFGDPSLEFAYILRNVLLFIFPQSLYEVSVYSLSEMRI